MFNGIIYMDGGMMDGIEREKKGLACEERNDGLRAPRQRKREREGGWNEGSTPKSQRSCRSSLWFALNIFVLIDVIFKFIFYNFKF